MKTQVSFYAVLTSALLLGGGPAVLAQVKQPKSEGEMGQKLMQLGSREPDAKTAADVREVCADHQPERHCRQISRSGRPTGGGGS